jgi:hypothetical protein
VCRARALRLSFDNLAKSARARAFTKGSHLGPAAPKAPALFSNSSRSLASPSGLAAIMICFKKSAAGCRRGLVVEVVIGMILHILNELPSQAVDTVIQENGERAYVEDEV